MSNSLSVDVSLHLVKEIDHTLLAESLTNFTNRIMCTYDLLCLI